jgi:hypothetical protein
MVPTNFRSFRSKPITLWCLWPQVTPTHWQKCKDSFQEARILRGSSMWDLNSSNACLSVSFESMAAKENFETGKMRDRRMAQEVSKENSLKLIRGCSMGEGESSRHKEKLRFAENSYVHVLIGN